VFSCDVKLSYRGIAQSVGAAWRSHHAVVQRDRKSGEVTWRQLVPGRVRCEKPKRRCAGNTKVYRGAQVDTIDVTHKVEPASGCRPVYLPHGRRATSSFHLRSRHTRRYGI